jgi:2-dehydro-3-deoxygluconokinase
MPEIIAIGEPLGEFSQTTAGDPNYLFGHGGDTSNTIIAAARSGASTGYISAVGDDAFGRSFLELWRKEGVDVSAVTTDKNAHTGVYFITHGQAGHEFSYLRAGSAASRMTLDNLPSGMIRSAKVLHVSGISQAISPNAGSRGMPASQSPTTPTCACGSGLWPAHKQSPTRPWSMRILPFPASMMHASLPASMSLTPLRTSISAGDLGLSP